MSAIEKLKALVRFWVLSPQVQARYVTDIEWARDDCAEALAPFIAELEVEFEALRADAARYRWLRDSPAAEVEVMTPSGISSACGAGLDGLIDANKGK